MTKGMARMTHSVGMTKGMARMTGWMNSGFPPSRE